MPSVFIEARIIFFFQAEDGIRDKLVTGVRRVLFRSLSALARTNAGPIAVGATGDAGLVASSVIPRSEERRVGKEFRSRMSPCSLKTPQKFIYSRIELVRFAMTGYAPMSSATVTFPIL